MEGGGVCLARVAKGESQCPVLMSALRKLRSAVDIQCRWVTLCGEQEQQQARACPLAVRRRVKCALIG